MFTGRMLRVRGHQEMQRKSCAQVMKRYNVSVDMYVELKVEVCICADFTKMADEGGSMRGC